MDSSVVASNLSLLNPMLPLFIQFVFPVEESTGACVPLSLTNWRFSLTYKKGVPGRFSETSPTDWPLAIKFSGCRREDSIIQGLDFSALTWGQPSFFFVAITASKVASIDQSCNMCDGAPPANMALEFTESALQSSTFAFFGDVQGTLGESSDRTQNGTTARDCVFVAKNPWQYVGGGYYMRVVSDTTPYTFSWIGTQTREFSAGEAPVVHLANVSVSYIQDVSLGSVNVSRSNFDWWASAQNPAFYYKSPPSMDIYNAESNIAPEKNFGSYVHDTVFRFAWSVSLRRSAFKVCRWYWARPNLHYIPYVWEGDEVSEPSFDIDLDTDDPQGGFKQSLNDSFVCRRATPHAPRPLNVPPQRVNIADGSTLFRTLVVPLGRDYYDLCLFNASKSELGR